MRGSFQFLKQSTTCEFWTGSSSCPPRLSFHLEQTVITDCSASRKLCKTARHVREQSLPALDGYDGVTISLSPHADVAFDYRRGMLLYAEQKLPVLPDQGVMHRR